MATGAAGRVFRLADALVLLLLLMLPVMLLLGAAEGQPLAVCAWRPGLVLPILIMLPVQGAFRSPTLDSPYQGRAVPAAAVAVGGTE